MAAPILDRIRRYFNKPRRAALGSALIVLIVSLFIWQGIINRFEGHLMADKRGEVTTKLTSYGNALTTAINGRFTLLYGLQAFAQSEIEAPKSDFEDEFPPFAAGLYASIPGIRNFSIAPDGVLKYVYPLKGNEAALNHDLINDERPNVRADVQRAIETGVISLSDPYELMQGGLGVVARQAIYQEGDFWGLSTMVLDIESVITDAGLNDEGIDLIFALRDDAGMVFWGDGASFENNSVIYTVELPDATWELAAVPATGWSVAMTNSALLVRGSGLFSILLMMAVAYLVVNRQSRLDAAIAQRTSALSDSVQALQATESRYRTLFDKASDAIMISNLQGDILDANQLACEQLAYSQQELLTMQLKDFLAPQFIDVGRKEFAKLAKTGHVVFETGHLNRNGRFIPVELSATMIAFEEETAVLSIARDITKRQQAQGVLQASEARLKASEARYRNIFESTAVSIWEEDFSELKAAIDAIKAEGVVDFRAYLEQHPRFEAQAIRMIKVLNVNEATLRMYGAQSKEELLDSLDRIFTSESLAIFREGLIAIAKGLPHFMSETVNQTFQGEWINCIITITFPAEKELWDNVPVSMIDITERRRTQDILQKSEELLNESQRIAHIGSWELDLINDALYWSDETYRIFEIGSQPPGPTYQTFLENIHPDDRHFVDKAYTDSIKNKTLYNIVHRLLLKDGIVKYVNERGQTIYNDAGKPIRSIGTTQDITQQIQAETALKKRNEELTILYETAMTISANLDLDTALKTVVKQFSQALQVEGCALSFWYKEQDYIETFFDYSDAWPDKVDPPGIIYHLDNYPATRRVLETQQPISLFFDDPNADPFEIALMAEQKYSNLLMLPLVVHNQVWGLVELFDKVSKGDYTGEEIRLAQSLAAQAAVAIQNARLHEEVQNYTAVQEQHIDQLRTRERHLEILNNITQAALGVGANWSDMLQLLADRMGELLAADACYITLWDEVQQKTMLTASYASYDPLKNSYASFQIEPDEITMTRSVMEAGHALVVEDVYNTPYLSPRIAAMFPTHSVLGLPLIAGSQKLGVALIAFNQLHKFMPDEIARGEQAAGQIALAIARAKLLEETQHQAAELEGEVAKRTVELQQRVAEVEQLNKGMINLLSDLQNANEHVTQTAQQLEASNIELESFAYSISHDLRAPLRHINGFATMLIKREQNRLDDVSTRYLTIINDAATKMGKLIDDLLAFSRMGRQSLHMKPVNVNQVVAAVQREVIFGLPERTIVWEIGELPMVMADLALLRQVWINLLENSIKYSATRSEAIIRIGAMPANGKGFVTFFVHDNGVGFDPQYVDKLFGVFQRLHRDDEFEGTGIGLATVRRIINRHGGSIWAEGVLDVGASFYFTLKAAPRYEEKQGGQ